jgi:hypothetical protein
MAEVTTTKTYKHMLNSLSKVTHVREYQVRCIFIINAKSELRAIHLH